MKRVPEKMVERLLKYLELVKEKMSKGEHFVFSHELAERAGVSAVQVRRDLMEFDIKGTPQKGYPVEEFFSQVCSHVKCNTKTKLALVGVGNLGKAILSYFLKRRPNLEIVAAFDSDDKKTNRIYCGYKVYHISDLYSVAKKENISVGIITVPAEAAQEIADMLVKAGIKGIVNFAPQTIKVPSDVFVEQIDITLSIEKTAYFAHKMCNRR